MALDEVFIGSADYPEEKKGQLIRGFEEMGVTCHYNLGIFDGTSTKGEVGNFGDFTVVTYSAFHSSYKRQLIKRCMDIAGGLVGSALTLILMPFLAAAIKLDSPGRCSFPRPGSAATGAGLKYTSSVPCTWTRRPARGTGAGKRGEGPHVQNGKRSPGDEGRAVSAQDQPGRIPQFFNVLIGDMSLVGTRPPTEDEFEKYNLYYRRRISMTPGLTGMWQVSGRSDIDDFDEVVKLDLKYIDNWSLTLDLKILARTVAVVLFGKGAK